MLICWKKRENWHCLDSPYISKISDAIIAGKCAPESSGKAIWCSGWYNVPLACINYPPMGRTIYCEQSIAQWFLLSYRCKATGKEQGGQVRRGIEATMECSTTSSLLHLAKKCMYPSRLICRYVCRQWAYQWNSGASSSNSGTALINDCCYFLCVSWNDSFRLTRISNVWAPKTQPFYLLLPNKNWLHGKQGNKFGIA